ncbi:YraN family protein [Palleronia sp.]|uniref:YraN family protein n=1 Tax=Palleronia sp. TaxID=1940284 RepID=UPI0035C7FED0
MRQLQDDVPDQPRPTPSQPPEPSREKQLSGALAHHAGLAAEDQVARVYTRRGALLVARRWRSRWGEIDLIFREGERVVFVEVKRAKRHGWALERVSPRQIARIHATAELYLEAEANGSLTEARVDVATVDGAGRVEILENAFM